MTTTTQAQTMDVSAKLAAEVILGKIRLNLRQSEPPYLPKLRQLMMQIKKAVGDETFNDLSESLRPVIHALCDALFDAVTETKLEETTNRLRELPMPHRLAVEVLVQKLTGKSRDQARWDDDLHRLHNTFRQITDLSVSGLTMADIREGYDPFMHAIVDHLFNMRATLVS